MGLNTQFPSWVAQGQLASQELGQQMGRNILEGLRFQEQKRQAAEEQRRYDELAPMRTAQMELMRARTTQEILQNEKMKAALDLENRFNANQIEALKFQEGIARSAGGYTSPENEASFYRFLSKNPDWSKTDWAKKMEDRFKTGREDALKADLLEKTIRSRETVAEIRAQTKPTQIRRQVPMPGGGFVYGTEEELQNLAQTNEQLKKVLEQGILEPTVRTIVDELGRKKIVKTYKPGTFEGDEMDQQAAPIALPQAGSGSNVIPGATIDTRPPSGTVQIPGFTIRAK